MKEEQNKVGRPKKDLTEILQNKELILSWFKKGISLVEFRARLHEEFEYYLPESTLFDIVNRVKDCKASEDEILFSELINIGKSYSQRWWETFGRENLIGTKENGTLNAGVYNKLISNMFPDTYKEKEKSIDVKSGDMEVSITIDGENF